MKISYGEIEDQRLTLQATLDREKTQAERNKLGQFSTPTDLARELLAYTLNLIGNDKPIRFLDPAIGTGSFYSALLATKNFRRIDSATGFEIDPHYARPASQLWTDTPLQVIQADFTSATPPTRDSLFNLVICNPPYVRHHHMDKDEKIRLQDASELSCGVRSSGLAGLYTYFLALAHTWMAESGIAAWLIPSEFMDVNYGKAVKKYLQQKVTLLRIHRFDPNDGQFGDALVSSAIVWFKKEVPPKNHEIEFTFGGNLGAPKIRKLVSAFDLANEAKWTRYPVFDVREVNLGPKLNDFFKIQRGLATGDNKFFILTSEKAKALGLPKHFLRPILPSPRYLTENEILADFDGNPIIDNLLFLLDCNLSEQELRTDYPTLWKYYQTGIPSVSGRYLCAHRSPWYSQEDRPPSPFVCTYMGRSDNLNGGPPFRFLLNHSQATVSNGYLVLYPKANLKRAIDHDSKLTVKIWKALQAICPSDLLDEGRVYGGGLHKMEPKELAGVPAQSIASLINHDQQVPVGLFALNT